ncbi:MAG TPA: ATP-binding protein, partial [Marinagarivorans sp.]|nr:ATP-binding protein [Marinagarivorans sp.]
TKPQGTGLGLAVVQSVARAHGGRFHLQSTEGKGTQASLILPLV